MVKQLLEPRTLSENVFRSIYLSNLRGKMLAKDYPEIADEFRNGKDLRQLAQKYVGSDYNISQSVAINSIYNTLKILIDEEELKKIGKEHIRTNSRKVVVELNKTNAQKKGYRKGIGRLTKKEMHEMGRESAISRGQIPFYLERRKTEFGEMNEPEYIIYLKEEAEQIYTWKEIADEVNEAFNSNRNWMTLRTLYQKWTKK